jgi:ABC-type amino acid transport substrate-binding protein
MRKGSGRGQRRTAIGLSALLVCTAALLGSCGHRAHKAPPVPPVIRAGIAPDFPPLCFREDGEIQGIEADLVSRLGQEGLQVKLVPMPFDTLLGALQEGQIDVIMSGMSITVDRVKVVDFTVPYLRVGQMALVRRPDYDRLRRTASMNASGVRIGFITGTTGEKYARQHMSQATLIGLPTVEAAVAALRGNRIDVFITDAPIIWQLTSRRAGNDDLAGVFRPLTREYIAWAVRRGPAGDALRERLNIALLQWQANGQLEDVMDRWITVRRVTLEAR